MKLLRAIWTDCRGAMAVEFALVGPLMITVMLGVVQIGMSMWNFNGLRGVASDTARFAVINYQTNNELTNAQIQSYGRALATQDYGMVDSNLTITVVAVDAPRVAGATELTMTINYNFSTLLSIIGIPDIPMSYSRPIFLMT